MEGAACHAAWPAEARGAWQHGGNPEVPLDRRFDPLLLLACALATLGGAGIAALEGSRVFVAGSAPAPWIEPRGVAPVLAGAALLVLLVALDALVAVVRTLLGSEADACWPRVLVAVALASAPVATLHPLVTPPALAGLLLLHHRATGSWAQGLLVAAAAASMGMSLLLLPDLLPHGKPVWIASYLLVLAVLVAQSPVHPLWTRLCWAATGVLCAAPLFTTLVWPAVF